MRAAKNIESSLHAVCSSSHEVLDSWPARVTGERERLQIGELSEHVAIRALLSRFELTSGLSSELVEVLLTRCPVRRVVRGEMVITAGVAPREMYIVLSGVLRVHVGEQLETPIAVLRAGDTVAEMSTLDHRPPSATVIADTDASLLTVDESMFWHIVHSSHAFCTHLLFTLVERLRTNNDTVLAKMELCTQLESVALTDALTGVNSRRWLDDTLPKLCERSRFGAVPMCVAMLDIDHFKRVNDTYGHLAGDVVLAAVAKAIRARLRPTDFVARYGGEEFIVVFPNTARAGARVAAERLREFIGQLSFEHPGLALPSSVTVSVGLSEVHDDDNARSSISKADAALYRAKSGGRNRVED
ncbi:MAG TPA: GGDEF domain-containing protein [Polyangiales bacterium]